MYAWLMPASTVMQAVIGGITVLTGLLWWTVAIHLLVSMAMVWLAVLLLREDRRTGRRSADAACAETVAPVDHSYRCGSGGPARHRHPGDRCRPARRRQEHRRVRCRGWRWRSPRWCSCTRRCCWLLSVAAGRARLRVDGGAGTAAGLLRLGVLLCLGARSGSRRHGAVLHRRARRAGGDPRSGSGRMHGGHRGAMGVDARADRARAGPGLTRRRCANWRC